MAHLCPVPLPALSTTRHTEPAPGVCWQSPLYVMTRAAVTTGGQLPVALGARLLPSGTTVNSHGGGHPDAGRRRGEGGLACVVDGKRGLWRSAGGLGEDGTAESLARLRERRVFRCRLSADRAPGPAEQADAFLRDRGLLTRTAGLRAAQPV
jgi:hypothetical protein